MTLLLVHGAATWFMAGLIWTVQAVHYPLFRHVGPERFERFEASHTRRIGLLLAGPAITEVVAAALLLFARPDAVPLWLVLVSGALLFGIWVMTALVQAPIHGRLGRGHDPELIERLVSSNRWRTGLWTVRGVLAAVILAL